MSRIPPDRVGYDGYEKVGIDKVVLDPMDCDSNGYLQIPREFEGVTNNVVYYPRLEYLSFGSHIVRSGFNKDPVTGNFVNLYEVVQQLGTYPGVDIFDRMCYDDGVCTPAEKITPGFLDVQPPIVSSVLPTDTYDVNNINFNPVRLYSGTGISIDHDGYQDFTINSLTDDAFHYDGPFKTEADSDDENKVNVLPHPMNVAYLGVTSLSIYPTTTHSETINSTGILYIEFTYTGVYEWEYKFSSSISQDNVTLNVPIAYIYYSNLTHSITDVHQMQFGPIFGAGRIF